VILDYHDRSTFEILLNSREVRQQDHDELVRAPAGAAPVQEYGGNRGLLGREQATEVSVC
jgi:hypothetical protein